MPMKNDEWQMIAIFVAALTSVTTIALGFGWFLPVSDVVSGFLDLVAVGSTVLFVGLLDGR